MSRRSHPSRGLAASRSRGSRTRQSRHPIGLLRADRLALLRHCRSSEIRYFRHRTPFAATAAHLRFGIPFTGGDQDRGPVSSCGLTAAASPTSDTVGASRQPPIVSSLVLPSLSPAHHRHLVRGRSPATTEDWSVASSPLCLGDDLHPGGRIGRCLGLCRRWVRSLQGVRSAVLCSSDVRSVRSTDVP